MIVAARIKISGGWNRPPMPRTAVGLPVLDGLGAVGDGAHARNEWISVSGMTERAALAARVMTRLASRSDD